MPVVLLFNIKGQKAAKIKMLCSQLFIDSREVESGDFDKSLSYLLGMSDSTDINEDSAFEDEMLYISGLGGGMLNIFLDTLKRKKLTVALKAVQTETNLGFTPAQLCRELSREREALSQKRALK